MLLDKQDYVSHQFPMPVDVTDESSRVTDVSGETVQFVVASTNVNDAGSAAGTVIYARLTNGGVLDAMRARIGNKNNSSFSFGTGTCLTTQRFVDFKSLERAYSESKTLLEVVNAVTTGFANGDFVLDYRTGIIFGKKATTAASDTAGYSYRSSVTTSATGSTVNLTTGTTSTRTTVTPSLTSQSLIAANTGRLGLRVVLTSVDPSQNVWIATAATATSAIYFTKLTGSSEANLFDSVEWPYTGAYSVISDVASGTIQIYQLTA